MSQITLLNQTDEVVRVAIFKKPVIQPSLATIAWQIADTPPGGQAVVNVPSNFEAYARYSLDPNNPEATEFTTNKIPFNETTAKFDVNSVVSQDRQASGAHLEQSFTDLVMNEVRMVNNFGIGVWGHITKDGDDIYAPQVIWPGAVLMEDIRSSLYLAVVGQFTYKGDRLVQEEISLTETEILEGGTATVTGSMWKGYSIAA
ncbi:MAG: hypothetical protein AAGN66_08265 [Acidobacteriota bacterium]